MEKALEQHVRARAGGVCEYCHAPQKFYPERFQIDHIIARQHGGRTTSENLALCCLECNRRKGPNIAGIDPETRLPSPLFHPRRDGWSDHFRWRDAVLVGLTPVARTTIAVLDLNRPARIAVREALIDEGVFPPPEDSKELL